MTRRDPPDPRAVSDERLPFFAPRFWLGATAASLGAWIGFGLLFTGFQYFDLKRTGNPQSFMTVVASAAPFWIAWAVLSPFALRWAQRWPFARRCFWRSAAMQILGGTLTVMMALAIMALVTGMLQPNRWEDPRALLSQLVFFGIAPGILIYAATAGVGSSLEYARRLRCQTLRAVRIDAELHRARLEALLHQLQPHFVFNTLHAIASLVRKEETRSAIEMISRLGELLRRTLRCGPGDEVALSEELDLVEQYLDIERVRLGDRLGIRFDIDPAAACAHVPVLLLLPIVENAVRHGIAPVTRACQLSISARIHSGRLSLCVENDGAPLEPSKGPGEGVGLDNSRRRLETLFGSGFSIDLESAEPGARTRIEIPLREGEATE
ncbi:MAG: histidine kinase [Planctomycetota bacterium]